MEVVPVNFERYAIIKEKTLYIIFVENETIFITTNAIYTTSIVIDEFPIYSLTPLECIRLNNNLIFYKEYDRHVVQADSALDVAETLLKHL